MQTLACESRIIRVAVYARGAIVTRRVEVPAGLGPEETVLELAGITPSAEPSSVRTHTLGERHIAGLRAPLHWRQPAPPLQPDAAELNRLHTQQRLLASQAHRLQIRRDMMESLELQLELAAPDADESTTPQPGIAQRMADGLRANALKFELLARYEQQLADCEKLRAEVETQIDELHRKSSSHGATVCERKVQVTLAPGPEHLRALEVSYAVPGARWWPAYAARISNGGRNAEFALEAFVAQATGENWTDVELSLCTADMLTDVRLPELASLRFGRRQPPKRTGFREPPEGLDELFAGFDTMLSPVARPAVIAEPTPSPADYAAASMSMPPPAPPAGGAMPKPQAKSAARRSARDEGSVSNEMAKERAVSRNKKSGRGGGMDDMVELDSLAAPAAEMIAYAEAPDQDEDSFGGAAPSTLADSSPPTADAEEWLDFDALELPDPAAGGQRGRLQRGRHTVPAEYVRALSALEGLYAPGNPSDPKYARGLFDHSFRADGLVQIPADAVVHRVRLLARECQVRTFFRCVPLAELKVYRESELQNPLHAPLLPGPIDVFLDGVLLTTTRIEGVDRGGTVRFGLGEEQRISVARNIRVSEESKGLLGGKTAVDHHVSIEAANGMAAPVELELLERLPVTDDKDIEVKLLESTPRAEPYDQKDRDQPVRGGLRFKLKLEAGAKAEARLSYRISFDSGHELVGGNRRE